MADKPFIKLAPYPINGGEGALYMSPNQANRSKVTDWREKNPGEMARPAGPTDTVHKRGGKVGKGGSGGMTVNNYCAGGKVISSKTY